MSTRVEARFTPRRLDLLTIALPCLLAAALAAYELGTRSVWLDEAATVAITAQHGAALWRAIAHDGGNMLAFYLLLHVLTGLFGDGQVLIRLPAAVSTVATVGVVGVLALTLFGDRRVAGTAAAVCAVSLPLIYWGQEARAYAPMATFIAGSWLALARRAPRAYFVCLALAMYMGFIAALVVPAQLLVLWLDRRRARAMLIALAAAVLCCVPLAVLAVERGSGQLFWVPGPSLSVLSETVQSLTSAGYPPNFHRTATTIAAAIVLSALLLAALAAAWRASGPARDGARVVVLWLLVPVLLGLALSAAGEPVELARNTVMVLPAVALLLGWALWHERLPASVAWAGVAVVLALRALQLAPAYGVSPEPWNAATRYVLASTSARAGDPACVAFYPQDGRMPFDYYLRRAGAAAGASVIPAFPDVPWSTVRPYVERYAVPPARGLAVIARHCPTLWLLASHQGQKHGPSASRANLRRYDALVAALAHLWLRQRGRTFGWAAAIRVLRFSR